MVDSPPHSKRRRCVVFPPQKQSLPQCPEPARHGTTRLLPYDPPPPPPTCCGRSHFVATCRTSKSTPRARRRIARLNAAAAAAAEVKREKTRGRMRVGFFGAVLARAPRGGRRSTGGLSSDGPARVFHPSLARRVPLHPIFLFGCARESCRLDTLSLIVPGEIFNCRLDAGRAASARGNYTTVAQLSRGRQSLEHKALKGPC